MRYPALLVSAAVAMFAVSAHAQPLAGGCYSPDRLGWSGPFTALGCFPCCGCRSNDYSMQWQIRAEDAGWSTQPISSVPGRYTNTAFGSLTHQERYCLRMRFADDAGPGAWGPTIDNSCNSDAGRDVCFTFDSVRPSTPVLLDGGVIAGTNRIEVHFSASTDDGGGVGGYHLRYLPVGASSVYGFGIAPSSPVSDVLGAGTWTVAVFAEDLAFNASGNSAPLVVTLGFDASVASPPAPSWPTAVTNDQYVAVQWPDDGADSWVVTQRSPDGGWSISARPRVDDLNALLYTPGPCRLHSARIARVLGDQVSDWSPPSADLLVDTVGPVAFAPTLVSFDGGSAELTWPAASDSCASGVTYFLERSVNGGPFSRRATTTGTRYVDPVDGTGQIVWRVVAEDGAGNRGESNPGASLFIETPADAGTDAGAPDGGEPEAATSDAGMPDPGVTPDERRELIVGCGCQGGFDAPALLLLLAAVLRRRQRVGGLRIS